MVSEAVLVVLFIRISREVFGKKKKQCPLISLPTSLVSMYIVTVILIITRGFNNFGDKRLFEVEQTAVIEKGP